MIYLFIIALVTTLDQISKYFVTTKLMAIGSVPLIKNVFYLTYARNTGAAFSIFRDKQLFLILFTFLAIALIGGLLIKNVRNLGSPIINIGIAFIIGGALGNIIDRIRLNYVIDYFDFRLINFAIFNVADSFIVMGAVLLGVAVIFLKADLKI
ncbi:signal peptidase II [Helicovermis profundi]|uniref:Lipoprotein signal peptidase n=1 Tax=Helicovermis profundi TaxID=3065157 RepID=A0AAU9EUD0_9FIRM|nr:signal peptidase II [Clostridia bacterium S502]